MECDPLVCFLSRLLLEDRLDDVEFHMHTTGDDKLPNLIFNVIQRISIPCEFARLRAIRAAKDWVPGGQC
jgi:hypothetical protein